ncbi:MAG: energy transducer TonB, partial [Sediminibacterium sp.]|nr:energy transducer TonB [Sediminibacterium sp.]
MENEKIKNADFLEILFDGRFKEYGAYDLRKTYVKRIQKGFFGMVLVLFLLIGGSAISNSIKSKAPEIVVNDVDLEKFK